MAVTNDQPQHMTALQQANAVRLARAQLCKDVSSGKLPLASALHHPAAQTMPLAHLLAALPWRSNRRPGTARGRRYNREAEKLLDQCGIGVTKVVGTLTARQRRMLNAAWRERRVDLPAWQAQRQARAEARLQVLGTPQPFGVLTDLQS